jgi:hypothetical protein
VNGIDSTYLIQGANSIPDFYDKFVTFTYTGKDVSWKYSMQTSLFNYEGYIDKVYKQLTLGGSGPTSHNDSAQCKYFNNTMICSRDILNPEYNNYGRLWDIKRLTSKELVIETSWKLKNSYKIILTH